MVAMLLFLSLHVKNCLQVVYVEQCHVLYGMAQIPHNLRLMTRVSAVAYAPLDAAC